MVLRELSQEHDWPILHAFWRARGMQALNPRSLPPTGLVAVREEDETLLCGAFLVKSDTNTASLAFVCGNPLVPREERSEGLDSVILALAGVAREAGYEVLGIATNVPALQARYERLGFRLVDENVKVYGGSL